MTEVIKNHAFKIKLGTVIASAIFLVSSVSACISWKKDMESKLDHLNGATSLYAERYAETISSQQELKIEIAKIQTELENIGVTQDKILMELRGF